MTYRYYEPPRIVATCHAFGSRDRLVFAHRGGAGLAPENTLAAFDRGAACGADGLECDVHLSRDGIPVVIHDKTLDRTTNGSGSVGSRSADELARVDAGFRFTRDGAYPFRGQDVGVPRLETVVRRFRDLRMIIEMKQPEPALARAVIDVVRRTDAASRVCVGSFHRQGLDVVRREAPEIATSASEHEARWTLYRSWCRWPRRSRRPYCAFQVPERAGRLHVVTRSFLRQAHGDGARVDVWVVDTPDDIIRLFAWGVDGVISDRPDVAVRTRDAWKVSDAAPQTAPKNLPAPLR